MLYRRQLEDVSPLIRGASSVLTNWRRVGRLLKSVWAKACQLWRSLLDGRWNVFEELKRVLLVYDTAPRNITTFSFFYCLYMKPSLPDLFHTSHGVLQLECKLKLTHHSDLLCLFLELQSIKSPGLGIEPPNHCCLLVYCILRCDTQGSIYLSRVDPSSTEQPLAFRWWR